MAQALKVSVRTLNNWERVDGRPAPRVGRPPHSEAARQRAKASCEEALKRFGFSSGEVSIHHLLKGDVPRRLVREALKDLKADHRRRLRHERQQHRTSVMAFATGAIWALDGTHLGRFPCRCAVEGQILIDGASRKVLEASAGPPACGLDVIKMLKRARRIHGGLPLVLMTDNGGPYIAQRLAAYLKKHQVIHLFSLPRTPQHNATCERTMRTLKEGTLLGKGCRLPVSAIRELLASQVEICNHRPRASLRWDNPQVRHEQLPPWYTCTTRDAFHSATCKATEAAQQRHPPGRARRRAIRHAILATLEEHLLIHVTRGGLPFSYRNRK